MSDKLFCLPVEQQLTPYISLCKLDQLSILVIKHPEFRAAIALQGAHLLSWQPINQAPVIWLSENAVFKKGQAIRGGIPLCWPWFGKSASPSHGFARNKQWQLQEYKEDNDTVRLSFMLEHDDATLALWPHPFRLVNNFCFNKYQLDIQLTSFGNFDITTALHTYLNIGDIDQTSVCGLGNHYLDALTATYLNINGEKLLIHGEIDRIYDQSSAITKINDAVQQRTLIMTHYNHRDIVVWNPYDKAQQIADMTEDGYKKMLCIETACINHALTATKDQPAVIGMTLHLDNHA